MASDPRANLKPLSLHVPEPKFRPGDAVDFADVEVPPAGTGRRPDVAENAAGFAELAYGLVRVLDEDGKAIHVSWKESDGPAVVPPSRSGFGSRLIRSAIVEPRGPTTIAFEPGGVTCELHLRSSTGAGEGTTAS